jgi:PIN domain
MRLALAEAVRAHWTEAIHEEWMRSVLANRPDLKREQLERTRSLMNQHVHDALVEGYESLIPGLVLPDPDDRHVLAAAIRAGAGVIVTFNLKDFTTEALVPYGLRAEHPDEFICRLLDHTPDLVSAAAKEQRASLKNPPKTVPEYLATLESLGLTQTVARLRAFEAVL